MNIGDKITVLSSAVLETVSEHGIIIGITKTLYGRWQSCTDDNWRSLINPRDEGIYWIYGHHDSWSKEVDAMRVAGALGTSRALPLNEAQIKYMRGEIPLSEFVRSLDAFDAETEAVFK